MAKPSKRRREHKKWQQRRCRAHGKIDCPTCRGDHYRVEFDPTTLREDQ